MKKCTAPKEGHAPGSKAERDCPVCGEKYRKASPGNMKTRINKKYAPSEIPSFEQQMKTVQFNGGNEDPDAPQLMFTCGLPASGKTTFAKMWVADDPENRVNVNRDDIRGFLGCLPIGTPDQEATVSKVSKAIIEGSLQEGKSVIVSDTNLRSRFVKDLVGLGLDNDAAIYSKSFKVSLEELLKRDKERIAKGERGVGEEVLTKMHKSFQKAPNFSQITEKEMAPRRTPEPYNNDPSNPPAILVDIDGTLAHTNGKRSPYDYTKVLVDDPDDMVINAVIQAKTSGSRIIIMSGREDSCEDDTRAWLDKYKVPYDDVHMRKTGDQRPDWIIKDELVREHVAPHYHVKYALDDRQQVVDHHRKAGYKVFQVQPGDF